MLSRLAKSIWPSRREADLARLRPLAEDRVRRNGLKHAIYDFLFEYYSFRPAHLLRWSPGVGVMLEGATIAASDWPKQFAEFEGGIVLNRETFPSHRLDYVKWSIRYLETTGSRKPSFGCFGLHEWAMVHGDGDIRHARVPLRLSREATNEAVESNGVNCTHFDAFRFFTPSGRPFNKLELDRAGMIDHDQPGCVHANMDLYKFAYKLAPFINWAVLASAFELATAARILDMRASPYDVTEFGFTPIAVETKTGREEYAEGQREIYRRGIPVREAVLNEYRKLVDDC